MKTTLSISDPTMDLLKKEAVRQKRTMSELVEAALHLLFKKRSPSPPLPKLPTFNSGGARVNVANRDALYDVSDFNRFPFLEVVDPLQ